MRAVTATAQPAYKGDHYWQAVPPPCSYSAAGMCLAHGAPPYAAGVPWCAAGRRAVLAVAQVYRQHAAQQRLQGKASGLIGGLLHGGNARQLAATAAQLQQQAGP